MMNLINKLSAVFNVSIQTLVIGLFCILLPILFTGKTLDPALTIRTLSLSFCALILIISYLFNKKHLLKPSYAVYALLLLLLLSIISSVFSEGIKSETLQSIVKLGGISILTYSLTTEIRQRNNKLFLIKAIVLFSLIAIIVVLTDYVYILHDYKDQLVNKNVFIKLSSTASFATNRNLLASIFLLTFPFNIYSLYHNSKIWKWLSVTVLLLSMFIILITTSKAGIFVLCLYLFSMFCLLLISKHGLWKKAIIALGFFICCAAGFYVLTKNKTFKRFAAVNTIDEFKASARWMFYKNTFDIIKKHPVLGVGPGNWKFENEKYDKLNTKGETGYTIAQRPHNDFLWLTSEVGVLGGVLYISIFLMSLIMLVKRLTINSQSDKEFVFILIVSLLGFAIISFFDFPFERIEHLVLFSFIISFACHQDKEDFKVNNSKTIIFSGLILCLFSSYISFARHNGEVHLNKALYYKSNQQWNRVIKEINKGYKEHIYEIDRSGTPLDWHLGLAYFNTNAIEKAFKSFQKAYEFSPYHLHTLNNLATCYELKGERDKAIQYYLQALQVSPKFEDASINLAAVYFNEKRYVEALDVILRCDNAKDKVKYQQYLSTIFNRFIAENNLDRQNENLSKLLTLMDEESDKFNQEMQKIYQKRIKENKTYEDLIN